MYCKVWYGTFRRTNSCEPWSIREWPIVGGQTPSCQKRTWGYSPPGTVPTFIHIDTQTSANRWGIKSQFTIFKKQAGTPLFSDMVLSRQYWNRRKWVFPQYWNSQQPLWVIWYRGKVFIHHIAGLSLGFISSYCANEGIFAFMAETYGIILYHIIILYHTVWTKTIS